MLVVYSGYHTYMQKQEHKTLLYIIVQRISGTCTTHMYPGSYPRFFFSSSWLTNVHVDEMKDLGCSSTVRLLSTQI